MKHLLMTTALAAFTAMPVAAETNSAQSGQSATQGQVQGQSQMVLGDSFKASELIGKRLYMANPRADRAQTETGNQNETQDDTAANDNDNMADSDMGDNARNEAGMNRNRDNWQMVGEIRDVVLNTDETAQALIVDSGGFLGMNANQMRVEIDNVRFVSDHQKQNAEEDGEGRDGAFSVVYTGDRAKFENSEAYDQERSAQNDETLGSETWDEREEQQRSVNIADYSTEELIGAPAYGSQNEWLGEIDELSIGENDKVSNVIVDVGGFLGIGEKPVALSVDEIELRAEEDEQLSVYLPHTEDELDEMETWEGDRDT